MQNLLPEPPATLLPEDAAAAADLAAAEDPSTAAGAHPAYSAAWAALAERAFAQGDAVTAYAFARTGYHRGLDQLRRSGWRGSGPVPWSHEPNRGFLRCVTVLAKAAEAIGETDEQERLTELLRDCDPNLAP